MLELIFRFTDCSTENFKQETAIKSYALTLQVHLRMPRWMEFMLQYICLYTGIPIYLPKIGRRKHTDPVAIGGIWMEELHLYPSTVLPLKDGIFQKFLRPVNHHTTLQLLNRGMLTLSPRTKGDALTCTELSTARVVLSIAILDSGCSPPGRAAAQTTSHMATTHSLISFRSLKSTQLRQHSKSKKK